MPCGPSSSPTSSRDFAFDPRRTAILLLGGNKADLWQRWYTEAVPMADTLYDEYLDELRRDGLIP